MSFPETGPLLLCIRKLREKPVFCSPPGRSASEGIRLLAIVSRQATGASAASAVWSIPTANANAAPWPVQRIVRNLPRINPAIDRTGNGATARMFRRDSTVTMAPDLAGCCTHQHAAQLRKRRRPVPGSGVCPPVHFPPQPLADKLPVQHSHFCVHLQLGPL